MTTVDTEARTRHVEQSLPYEWRAVRPENETLIIHDVPEGTAACYRVVGTTYNVRVFPKADALLWDGNVVEPVYDDSLRCVRLVHDYAGIKTRVQIEEWVDDPVVLLERCATIEPEALV